MILNCKCTTRYFIHYDVFFEPSSANITLRSSSAMGHRILFTSLPLGSTCTVLHHNTSISTNPLDETSYPAAPVAMMC